MKYGKLTVLEEGRKTREFVKCLCDCGSLVEVRLNSLRTGNTKSCGCLRKKLASELFKTHGKSNSPEYTTWQLMKDRCSNPNNKTYSYYGGKSISVCPEWANDFNKFYFDMGERPSPKHTIDRIDSNGNYNKENCRWATRKDQARNRKNTKTVIFNGQKKPLAEWCELLGLDYAKTNKRLWRGWSAERAFTE